MVAMKLARNIVILTGAGVSAESGIESMLMRRNSTACCRTSGARLRITISCGANR